MYTRPSIGPLLHSRRRALGDFFRDVRGHRIDGLPLRCIADVRVAFQHLAIQMAGNAHDGLVTGFRLGQLRNGGVPQIVKPQPSETRCLR
jgi:hypothetical protein